MIFLTENTCQEYIQSYPGIIDKREITGSCLILFNDSVTESILRIMVDAGKDATVEIYTHIPGGHELKLFYRHRVDLQRTVVNVPQHAIAVITGKRGSPHNYVRIKYGLTNDEASNNINLIDNYVDLCTRVPSLMNGEVNLLWRGKSKESCLVHFVPKIPSVLHWKTIGVQNAIGIEANQIHVWMWNGSQFQPLMDMTVMEGRTATNVFLYAETMSNEFQVDISITYEFANADTTPQLTNTCQYMLPIFPGVFDKRQLKTSCILSFDATLLKENVKLIVDAGIDVTVEIFMQSDEELTLVRRHRNEFQFQPIIVPNSAVVVMTSHASPLDNHIRVAYSLKKEEPTDTKEFAQHTTNLCSRVIASVIGEVNVFRRGMSRQSCLVYFRRYLQNTLWWKIVGLQHTALVEWNRFHFWERRNKNLWPPANATALEGSSTSSMYVYIESHNKPFEMDFIMDYEMELRDIQEAACEGFADGDTRVPTPPCVQDTTCKYHVDADKTIQAPPCVQEGTCKDHVDADTSTQEPTCPQHVRQYPDECDERQPVSKCTLECDRNNANSNIKLHVGADEDAKVEIYSPVGNRMQMVYSSRFDEPRKTVVVVPIDVAGITGQCESRQNFAEPSNTPRSKCNCRMKPATSSDKTG